MCGRERESVRDSDEAAEEANAKKKRSVAKAKGKRNIDALVIYNRNECLLHNPHAGCTHTHTDTRM